jgi:hypothetical protein
MVPDRACMGDRRHDIVFMKSYWFGKRIVIKKTFELTKECQDNRRR